MYVVKLSTSVEVPYSDAERELFELLPTGSSRAISSLDLVTKRYGGSPPFHALAIIRATIGNLARKVEVNKEGFRIEKSERSGPHPIKFWIEKG